MKEKPIFPLIAGMALPMIGLMLLVLLLCTYFPQVPLCLVGGK